MSSRQKRKGSSSSSQPTKKQFLAPPKEVPSSKPGKHSVLDLKEHGSPVNPTPKSKGKLGGILKPNKSITNKGEIPHSSDGMFLLLL